MSSGDPLNFFAAEEDSSDSEEEEDTREEDPSNNGGEEDEADKLPSPDSLFKSIGRPSFLNNPNEKVINWDRFVKNSVPEEPSVHDTDGYAAIPPPDILSERSGPVTSKLTRTIMGTGGEGEVEYSAPPVTYDNGPVSGGSIPPTATTGTSQQQQQPVKRTQDEQTDSETPSAKKSKGALFRIKEKRKRDIGQTSRGKNYVEEEKRILRQQFGSDAPP